MYLLLVKKKFYMKTVITYYFKLNPRNTKNIVAKSTEH